MGDREIELFEPAPFIYCENGQLAITDGATVWMVIVTCEAMKATAPPPEKSLRRLIRFAEFYRDVAAAAIRGARTSTARSGCGNATYLQRTRGQTIQASTRSIIEAVLPDPVLPGQVRPADALRPDRKRQYRYLPAMPAPVRHS
jgi:hypothetical protein